MNYYASAPPRAPQDLVCLHCGGRDGITVELDGRFSMLVVGDDVVELSAPADAIIVSISCDACGGQSRV